MPVIDHIDLVVSSVERSLPFYRELLKPLGWWGREDEPGEQGETIHYLYGSNIRASIGIRQARGPADEESGYDRYSVGLHHLAFGARSRRRVNERARWLESKGVEIESGPAVYRYSPGYYAVFFYDPDGIKLEIVHRSRVRAAIRR